MTETDPITIRTTIYLNLSDVARWSGFRPATAQLHHAITFDLPILVGTRPATTAVAAALETIFEQLNVDPTAPWALQYALAGHRSLSVGDVVAIGETAWAVAAIGWNPVHADQLRDALNHR